MEERKSQRDIGDVLVSTIRFLKAAIEEILSGVINNRVPASVSYFGLFIAVILYYRLDVSAASLFSKTYGLPEKMRVFLIYTSIFSGWILWGIRRAAVRNRLLSRLKDAFQATGLKCNGRFPSLIEDIKIDNHVRKLRLHCHGVTKSDFEKSTERLESILNMTLIRVLQDENDKSKIELIYTMKDMEKHVILENPEAFGPGEIPIGVSHEGPVHINMRDVGHILVAGQTGGGKSNFLKVITTVLTRNNPEAKVLFLDFKGGMETADIRNHAKNLGDNIECFDGTKKCIEELGRIGMSLEERFQTLSEVGASSFDDYLKKRISISGQRDIKKRPLEICKTYIIIDEIAQLYAKDPEVEKEKQDKAKSAINRIARQGRAAGVHLIVATQKPDAQSFDQTVKTNLPAVLCFPMPNQVSSVSAIGTKRAFEINPNIRGRAVWKFGPRLEEVQTYLFA